jgi:hypothetical protein
MRSEQLDDFSDPAPWAAIASGLAELDLAPATGPHGPSLRLDFDFHGGGGFVVARRLLARTLPESWAIRFRLRGAAPANRLELKLVDPGGRNVWWRQWQEFSPTTDWQEIVVPGREVVFAYGPAGGGALREIGAIEFAVAAGPGGAGEVWIADLRLEDRTFRRTPTVVASSEIPQHEAGLALVGDPSTGWRSADVAGPHRLDIDFGESREFGGLDIRWRMGALPQSFRVALSDDGADWRVVHAADAPDGIRSRVALPGASCRHLRLLMEAPGAVGIREVAIEPFEVSRSLHAFVAHVARDEPRSHHPRWVGGEQSYWTSVGLPDGTTCAIMNEEGMIEPDRGSWSLEPFLYDGTRLLGWADAVRPFLWLHEGWMPIPSVRRDHAGLQLEITACAVRRDDIPVLHVCYRVTALTKRSVRLFVAVRPFQVNPPWQEFGALGGMSRIDEIAAEGQGARINGSRVVVPLEPPSGFGAAAFEHGTLTSYLALGELPPRLAVKDPSGCGAAAFAFDLEVAEGTPREVNFVVPFAPTAAPANDLVAGRTGDDMLDDAYWTWRERVAPVTLGLPFAVANFGSAMHTAAAYILVQRDGPALQPGPRRYTRSWIRDGAIMAAALLRVGEREAALEFVRWYAGFQADDGGIPCCIDRSGPDWLVEHDSHGEFVWLVLECFRFTGDRAFLDASWPAVQRALAHMDDLRAQRLGAAYADDPRRGLLPESASHEGYLSHPVHAYWDDFWALAAYRDAAEVARLRGDDDEARRLAATFAAFRADVRASLDRTIADRGIAWIPGSVEWADFDPTATANAVALLDFADDLPRDVLERSLDQYMEGFRRRVRGEVDWNNYSAYEIRIVAALGRLGRRDDAAELLEFLMADRRPVAWSQWPEISWRDPRSPGHIGDVPHAWIAAEYILAVRSLLVDERPGDGTLVLAAGVPLRWFAEGSVGVGEMPTRYGRLEYHIGREADGSFVANIGGDLVVPPGGIVLRPPLDRPLSRVEVNGSGVTEFDADSVTIRAVPATVRMQ